MPYEAYSSNTLFFMYRGRSVMPEALRARIPARLMRRHQRELAVRGVCHTHYPRFFGPNVKTRFSSSLFHVAEAT